MRLATEVTETENLFETLTNNSPVGLYIVQDGKFCYTNPTFQSTTGYKEDELLGRDALELVVPEDREQVRENAIKMLKGELTSPYQFRVTHKNGSIKWVMESVVSVQYRGRRATLGYFVDITERKRMEEALQDSEEKIRKMFESATDGISVIDLKGSITEVNQRTVEMHGYSSKDELRGKNALELLAPRDHKRIAANMKKVIKQGAIRGVEYTLLRADGSEFPGELSTNALKDASGNLFGHITIVRDITERKQVEEKMQHLNLVLCAIRNINKLIARGTDRDSLLKGACDTFVKTSGYYGAWIALLDESGKLVTAAEAGLGKSFLQVMERLKRGELTHCGCKVLEKPGVLVMKDVSSECEDCPVAKEDTGRGAISVRVEYSGKVYGLMTVYIPPGRAAEKEERNMLDEIAGDIGFALHGMEQEQEHKRMEEALQDSEEKIRKMFESATDGISVIDLKGIITEVNQRTVEMHGYSSKDELRGKNALELLAPRDHKRIAANMKKVIKQGAIRGVEYTLLRADGSEFPGELSTNALKDASGNLLGHITIVRDITERKQVEEKVQHLNVVICAIRNINQLIARGTDRNSLLKGACDTFVETRGYYSAWIALLDESGKLVTAAEAGVGKSFSQVMERLKRGELPHCGCKVLEKPGVLIIKDVSSECEDCPVAKEDSGRDAMSIRLEHGGKVYGLMTVSIPPGIAAEKEEHDLFEEIAGDIAFALHGMEQEQERKRAEEALQAEKNKLQSLIDAMEDTITIQDTEFNIIYQNEPSRIASGGDHLGEKCYRVYEGRENICEDCPVEKAFKDGKSHISERKTTISGNVAFWENTANPIRDAEGKIISCIELARDITERKKQEQALADELAQRRLLINKSLDGIVVLDEDAKVVEANQRFAEMLGYTLEEVHELHTWDWDKNFPPEKILKLGRNVDEKGLRLETKHTRKDGSVFDVDISISGIMCGGQKLIFCIDRDITERKRAEEALQTEKNKLQSVIDAMADALTIQDTEYNIIFQNEPSRKSTGGDRLGEKCYRAYEGRESMCEDCPVEKAFKDGKPHVSERQRVLPSGELSFWENTANPIRDAAGRVVACLEIGRDITERKKAEEALNLQRAYFQQLFDTSPDAIIMMDTNDRAIQVNKGFEKLFGYSNEEAKGRSLIELIVPEEDAQEASKSLEKILGGKTVRKERVRRRKDGSLVDVSLLAYPIRSNGKLVGAYGIYTDITERKKQEQALADELTRRRLLIDQSLDGIVVLDVDAKVVEANQSFAEMLGYTLEEVRELHTWDWDKNFPPKKILKMGRNVDEKGLHLETKHTRKDGSVIDVDISINSAMLGEQKLIFCVCRNITEHKKMEEALKLAAEEWRGTFNSITDAISIHDRDFRILRANKAFADIFHMRPDQIIGKYCYELHKGGKSISGCPHKQTLATGKPAAAEFYESHLGKYLLESTSPILDEKGEVVGTIHVTRDITEQKQQNERLMMADRLASIGELAAGTAHELNNPLTSVIGFSQLVMEKDIPDDIREDLKLIHNEAQRAANVTKNLLTFARKHAPVKQLIQINDIIEDVLKLRAYEHKVNSIEVQRQLAPDLPEIKVDYFQMQQVFLNIIINAEYFMIEAHNRGTLTITTKKRNGIVRISIADDGPGIPPENLSRIFDPFFTTKAAGKGTGLGLSICHGIVVEHGGQIYAKSQPGKGATIVVELPANGH